LIFVFRGLGLG